MEAKSIEQKIVGLIPAAGKAVRISPLPCSKEIYPVGFDNSSENKILRPKAISQYLIESMQQVYISEVYIIIRKGKWDIPQYLGNGKWMDMDFAYLIMDLPFGVPFTLDQAYNFVKDDIVVFGFPDIIFRPQDAFNPLLDKGFSSSADVVLGLFRAPQPYELQHMVDFDSSGRVSGFQINPSQTALRYTWVIAVWKPKFTRFLHEYVSSITRTFRKGDTLNTDSMIEEISMTRVFEAALHKGLVIDSISFKEGFFLDIGSPENLERTAQRFTELADFEDNKS